MLDYNVNNTAEHTALFCYLNTGMHPFKLMISLFTFKIERLQINSVNSD